MLKVICLSCWVYDASSYCCWLEDFASSGLCRLFICSSRFHKVLTFLWLGYIYFDWPSMTSALADTVLLYSKPLVGLFDFCFASVMMAYETHWCKCFSALTHTHQRIGIDRNRMRYFNSLFFLFSSLSFSRVRSLLQIHVTNTYMYLHTWIHTDMK